MKLTKESAQLVSKYGLTKGKSGVSCAMVGKPGASRAWLQVAKGGSGAITANPAVLAGAAGIMAQLAMQQAMDEITDYLAAISEKVDDVLRAQKDAVLAGMIGVHLVIEEAMTTQAYALRQLDALAEKVEHEDKIGDLAKTSREAEPKIQEWLAVLARCFQLQDAIAVLELDRVLDASPEELDRHRLGLRAARQNRLELIARSTGNLMARMDAAAGTANAKVLLHPAASRAAVESSSHVVTAVADFHERLGIERARQSPEARRWVDAATEAKDKALETGTEGVDAARRAGSETFTRARSMTDKLSSQLAGRTLRRHGNDEEHQKQG